MKITRQELAGIVAEEVRRRLRELHEAEDDSDPKTGKRKSDSKTGKGRSPETASADSEPPRKGPTPPGPRADTGSPDVSTPEIDQDEPPGGPAVDGDQPDPEAEDDPQDDTDAIDPEGDAGEQPSGAVNDEVSGKTVQAITIEPKSKVLPGAKEVIMAFNETTDPLRILVTSTGSVKFFWRGQMFDLP